MARYAEEYRDETFKGQRVLKKLKNTALYDCILDGSDSALTRASNVYVENCDLIGRDVLVDATEIEINNSKISGGGRYFKRSININLSNTEVNYGDSVFTRARKPTVEYCDLQRQYVMEKAENPVVAYSTLTGDRILQNSYRPVIVHTVISGRSIMKYVDQAVLINSEIKGTNKAHSTLEYENVPQQLAERAIDNQDPGFIETMIPDKHRVT